MKLKQTGNVLPADRARLVVEEWRQRVEVEALGQIEAIVERNRRVRAVDELGEVNQVARHDEREDNGGLEKQRTLFLERSNLERKIDSQQALEAKAHGQHDVEETSTVAQIGQRFAHVHVRVQILPTLVVVHFVQIDDSIVRGYVKLNQQVDCVRGRKENEIVGAHYSWQRIAGVDENDQRENVAEETKRDYKQGCVDVQGVVLFQASAQVLQYQTFIAARNHFYFL